MYSLRKAGRRFKGTNVLVHVFCIVMANKFAEQKSFCTFERRSKKIIKISAMKTKLLIAMLLLLFAAPQGIGAQSIFVNRGEMGYAGVKVFEYPMQVLDYKGKKIEAFANIIYHYDGELGIYTQLVLRMCFLPLDAEGFPADLQDSIAKYARHGTVVSHSGIMCKGLRQTIKGKADMFSKAFSVKSDNEDAQAEVKYSAVFDPENPANCKIDYKIKRAKWSKPDEKVETEARGFWNSDRWSPALHDVGRIASWDSTSCNPYYFYTLLECRSRRPEGDAVFGEKDVKCDSVFFYVAPQLEQYRVGDGLASAELFDRDYKQYALSKRGSMKVCVQESHKLFDQDYLPFMDGSKAVWIDYRAKAKCRCVMKQLKMEQVSFSCLFHY